MRCRAVSARVFPEKIEPRSQTALKVHVLAARLVAFARVYGTMIARIPDCRNTSTQRAAKNAKLQGRILRNKVDSCSPVASAAMASDCGEIILPTTPPMVFEAKKRSGEVSASAGFACATLC